MKELSLEEVLRIAGGLPLAAALDELTYRAPQAPAREAADFVHDSATGLHAPEPR
jgi:hypothetical protein